MIELNQIVDVATMVAALIAAAIAWRGRGGPFGLGSSQLTRIVCVALMASVACVVLQPWWLGLVLLLHWPTVALGWAEWQDQGSVADNDDFVGMMGRGFIQVAVIATALHLLGRPDASLAYWWVGALMGPIYLVAWRLPTGITRLNRSPVSLFGKNWIDGPCSLAEMATGAMLMGGYIAAVSYLPVDPHFDLGFKIPAWLW